MDSFNIGRGSLNIILFISTLSLIAGSNIDCNGKAFHCVNSTHFKICVDLGGGVSSTVDEFLIPCPQNTVCRQSNLFECEYELKTIPLPATVQDEVTIEQFQTSDNSGLKQMEITTSFPMKKRQGVEFSEKYDQVSETPASFTEGFLTSAVKDPVTLSNRELHASGKSNFNKTLHISRRIDRELTLSSIDLGIAVTQTSPLTSDTLVAEVGVSNNNTEFQISYSDKENGRTIDSLKRGSLDPLNQNSLDLDARFIVKNRSNEVSNSSDAVTLLYGNLNDSFLQDTTQTSNINRVKKAENVSQDSNLDTSIKYNKSQMNNPNNARYYNVSNSTGLNVLIDEIFSSDVQTINQMSKLNLTPDQVVGERLDPIGVDILSVSKKGHFPSNESQAGLLYFDEPVIERNTNNNTSRYSISVNNILPFTKVVTESVTHNNTNDSYISSTINILSDAIKIDIKNETRTVLNGFEGEVSLKKVENVSDLNSSLFLNNSVKFYPDYSTTSKSRRSDNRKPIAQKSYEIKVIKNETLPELVTVDTNLANSNSVTTLKTDITTEIPNKIKSLKFPELFGDTVDPDKITTTETYNNITTTMSNGVPSLKPILDLVPYNETFPEPFKDMATNLDSNNITITGTNNNIRTLVSNRITSLKPISDLIPNNETRPELFKDTVATDFDNNNITITETHNITRTMSNRVASLKPISDLISNNEAHPELFKDTVATDLDNNNITTTETYNNIKTTISNIGTSLKPISDLIPNNETFTERFKDTVATDLNNNNITVTETETDNNITTAMSNRVMILKPISDLIPNNETFTDRFKDTVATDLDNNNIITTEIYNNIKTTMSNIGTTLKPISDLIINNETFTERFKVTVATDLINNYITVTETDNNITIAMSNRFMSLKPISDLISNNETRPEPFKDTVYTNIDNNNITTTETYNNIKTTMSNIGTSLKPISDVIPNNETFSDMLKDTVTTDFDNNNITTTERYYNFTTTMSNIVTSLKPISDLIPNNETFSDMLKDTVTTDFDNNNITTTERYYNFTTTMSNIGTSLKPISDLIPNNETFSDMLKDTVTTDFDNNNITTTERYYNFTTTMSNIGTSLKPISDLIPNNETFSDMLKDTVTTDFDNNNITTTERYYNFTTTMSNRVTTLKPISDLIPNNETRPEPFKDTVATDLDNNNITTKETILGNNITTTISIRVTDLKSISDLNPIKENKFETTSTMLPDHQYWNEPALNLSTRIEIPDNSFRTTHFNTTNSLGPISSTERILHDLEWNNASISTSLSLVNKLTTLNNTSLGASNINRTHNNNDTKSVTDFFYGINKDSSYNSTVVKMNNEFEYNYETRRESDTPTVTIKSITSTPSFEFANSMDVTNNTITVVGVLSEYEVVSDNNKIIKNISKLESTITTDTPTYFDLNYTSNKDMISSKMKTVTKMSLESDKKEMYEKVNYKNSSNNVQILIKNIIGNSNLTALSTENIPVTKLLTPNNPSLSATLDIIDVTDKNNISFSKSEINYNHVENNLGENSLTTNVIRTDINNTDKNVASSVFSNSKSIPLKYLHSTFSNQLLKNIYNVSYNNVSENISLILSIDNTTAPNKQHVTEYNIPNVTRKNKEVMTTVKQVNDTLWRELSYSSKPSMILKNNVSYDFIVKNITSTLANRNSEPKHNYDTKGGGINERNNITNDKHVVDVNNNNNLSQIPNSQLSGNEIKRMIVQDQVNITELRIENENLSLITDRKNISKISRIDKVNNINSSNKFSVENINNWRDFNATLVVNDIKTSIRTKKNYTNDFNVVSEASKLLRKTSSQTNLIKNEFSVIPSNKSSQSNEDLDILKIKMRSLVSNKTTLKLLKEQDIIPISEDNIESNVTEKKLGNNYGPSELLTSIGNGVTKNIRQNTQNYFTTPTTNINYSDSQYRRLRTNLKFSCTKHGKFSNANDCNKFYICIGKEEPIIGVCPIDTVFSEFLKQCTRNVTHCLRKNQFKCTSAGRLNNISSNNTYFICAKTKSGFTRFTLQCQKGYHLDKNNTKCTALLTNISISDENSSKNSKESFDKSKEIERISVFRKIDFECENEGKFKDPQDCRRYYVCKKGRKSTFRRKIKKCDSDEVFHKKKKKCVDMESYECDI